MCSSQYILQLTSSSDEIFERCSAAAPDLLIKYFELIEPTH